MNIAIYIHIYDINTIINNFEIRSHLARGVSAGSILSSTAVSNVGINALCGLSTTHGRFSTQR